MDSITDATQHRDKTCQEANNLFSILQNKYGEYQGYRQDVMRLQTWFDNEAGNISAASELIAFSGINDQIATWWKTVSATKVQFDSICKQNEPRSLIEAGNIATLFLLQTKVIRQNESQLLSSITALGGDLSLQLTTTQFQNALRAFKEHIQHRIAAKQATLQKADSDVGQIVRQYMMYKENSNAETVYTALKKKWRFDEYEIDQLGMDTFDEAARNSTSLDQLIEKWNERHKKFKKQLETKQTSYTTVQTEISRVKTEFEVAKQNINAELAKLGITDVMYNEVLPEYYPTLFASANDAYLADIETMLAAANNTLTHITNLTNFLGSEENQFPYSRPDIARACPLIDLANPSAFIQCYTQTISAQYVAYSAHQGIEDMYNGAVEGLNEHMRKISQNYNVQLFKYKPVEKVLGPTDWTQSLRELNTKYNSLPHVDEFSALQRTFNNANTHAIRIDDLLGGDLNWETSTQVKTSIAQVDASFTSLQTIKAGIHVLRDSRNTLMKDVRSVCQAISSVHEGILAAGEAHVFTDLRGALPDGVVVSFAPGAINLQNLLNLVAKAEFPEWNGDDTQPNAQQTLEYLERQNGQLTSDLSNLHVVLEKLESIAKKQKAITDFINDKERLKKRLEAVKSIFRFPIQELDSTSMTDATSISAIKVAVVAAENLSSLIDSYMTIVFSQPDLGILSRTINQLRQFCSNLIEQTSRHYHDNKRIASKSSTTSTDRFNALEGRFTTLNTNAMLHAGDEANAVIALNDYVTEYLSIYDDMYNVRIMMNNRVQFDSSLDTKNARENFARIYGINHVDEIGDDFQCINLATAKAFNHPYPGVFLKSLYNGKGISVEYDVRSMLSTEGSKRKHFIYSAYGFSGSGKTYTLIENTTSVLHQLCASLQKHIGDEHQIKVSYYDLYGEVCEVDGDNNNKCAGTGLLRATKIYNGKAFFDHISFFNSNGGVEPHKTYDTFKVEPGETPNIFKVRQLDTMLMNAIKAITATRRTNMCKETAAPHMFHIRPTPNNDDSSRSHFFVDIEIYKSDLRLGKFTVLDMGGSEKVDVIQDMFFEHREVKRANITLNTKKLDGFKKNSWGASAQVVVGAIGKVAVSRPSMETIFTLNYKSWSELKDKMHTMYHEDLIKLLQHNDLANIAAAEKTLQETIESIIDALFVIIGSSKILKYFKAKQTSDIPSDKLLTYLQGLSENGLWGYVREKHDDHVSLINDFGRTGVVNAIKTNILVPLRDALAELGVWKVERPKIEVASRHIHDLTLLPPTSTSRDDCVDILRKFHCPIRDQGNYINKTLEELVDFAQNLQDGKASKVTDDNTALLGLLMCNEDADLQAADRKFVLLSNVRLDFDYNWVSMPIDKIPSDDEFLKSRQYAVALAETLTFASRVNPFKKVGGV